MEAVLLPTPPISSESEFTKTVDCGHIKMGVVVGYASLYITSDKYDYRQ